MFDILKKQIQLKENTAVEEDIIEEIISEAGEDVLDGMIGDEIGDDEMSKLESLLNDIPEDTESDEPISQEDIGAVDGEPNPTLEELAEGGKLLI